MEQAEAASAGLERLVDDARSVDATVSVLSEEIALFQKVMYKNHSQHRRAFFYQNLQEVKRFVRDIKLKDVKLLFADAVEVLEALRLKPGMHHISWKTLSTELKIKVDSALRRFVVLAQDSAGAVVPLTLNALCVVGDCTGLAAQFAMTYFMPFTLTMNGILARLTLLFKGLLVRAIEIHGGIALLYLNETAKSNPLRAKTTAVQLRGYSISPQAIEMANV